MNGCPCFVCICMICIPASSRRKIWRHRYGCIVFLLLSVLLEFISMEGVCASPCVLVSSQAFDVRAAGVYLRGGRVFVSPCVLVSGQAVPPFLDGAVCHSVPCLTRPSSSVRLKSKDIRYTIYTRLVTAAGSTVVSSKFYRLS